MFLILPGKVFRKNDNKYSGAEWFPKYYDRDHDPIASTRIEIQ